MEHPDQFDSYCSMIVISLHFPYISFETIGLLSRKIPSIFLAYLKTDCTQAQLECRWTSKAFDAVLGEGAFCGESVCLGMVPSEEVFDEVMAQNPMVGVFGEEEKDSQYTVAPVHLGTGVFGLSFCHQVDCEDFMNSKEKPASWTTQWQQDWFVYHNFFAHNPKRLIFAEIGAYHPFKYSNTLFFEKCLDWKGRRILALLPTFSNESLFSFGERWGSVGPMLAHTSVCVFQEE